MKKEMFDDAIFAFDYSLIINEFFPAAFYGKANGFIQKKEYEKAILVLNETFGLEQPHTFVYCTIGECYEKLEQYDKAATYYEKSIELDKDYPDAWIGLAVIYKFKEDYAKAIKHIDKAIKLDKTNIDFLSVKAEIYEDQKEFDKAIKLYKEILEIEINDEDTWFNFGALLADMENFEEAIDVLEKGYELTSSAEIFYKMTAVAFEGGNHSLGMSLLKKGIKIFKEEIDKFYEYFEEYKNDKKIMNLIDSIKD
jgi:tetratricopeptide (TPR) repeat protein